MYRRVRYRTYDEWKLASPDDGWYPECPACEDCGCPLCCETQPIIEDDLDMMEDWPASDPNAYDDPPRL
jgi:hypothetical protein